MTAITKEQYDGLIAAIDLLNGPADYSDDKEALGYIDDSQKMRVPSKFKFGFDYVSRREVDLANAEVHVDVLGGLTVFDKERKIGELPEFDKLTSGDLMLLIAALNWDCFSDSENRPICAFLRAALAVRGYLLKYEKEGWTDNGRHVYIDEVDVVSEEDCAKIFKQNIGALVNAINSDAVKFVIRNHVSMPIILDIVFVSRGHHFVGEDVAGLIVASQGETSGRYSYGELYRAIFKASFPGEKEHFQNFKAIFRTALHPFGVYIGRVLHKVYALKGKLQRALITRAKPAPAGAAKITTANAILKMMIGSPFLSSVSSNILGMADDIPAVAELIVTSPERYHQNSRLLGGLGLTKEEQLRYDRALAAANGIAPLLVGYVRTECADAPISKQKTLNKPAEDQAGLLKRVERMFRKMDEMANIERPETIVSAIAPAPVIAPGSVQERLIKENV
jgi:hypothetical protein